MAKARKDKRGYALRTGETQRKDGRYVYTYTNKYGQRKSIYAKTLPELRQKERKSIRDREDGLDPDAADRITLNEMFDKYYSQKYDLKDSTKMNYKYMYDHFVRDTFGKRIISKIKYSDVKEFYYSLMREKGLKPATVENVHTVVHPTLTMAVRDCIIRNNPADCVMMEIKKSKEWVKVKRHALTVEQQKAFMTYAKSSVEYRGWLPILTVLLGTGGRIGEILGLRWDDLDFENRTIDINHNIVYRVHENEDGKKYSALSINTPKTEAGCRIIPMIDEVYEAFLEELEIQRCIGGCKQVVDGYTNFVFTTAEGNVYLPGAINRAIKNIYEAYNAEEAANAEKEVREPFLLPHFSAHHLRHTFCTRFCENETNLKVIQSIMGHADISTTMDIYAEATVEKKKEILDNLQNKIMVM